MGTYATLAEVRAAGLTEQECDNTTVTALLESQSRYIDNITKNHFEPRTLTLYKDGMGTNTVRFGVPIISITSLQLVDASRVVQYTFAASEFLVYNRHLSGNIEDGDDRFNPKIELVAEGNMRPLYRSYTVFAKGKQNIKVVGSFGFTEYDLGVTANGITPHEIKDLCIQLVIRNSQGHGNFNRSRWMRQGHRVASETSDGSTYTMERKGMGAFTGDMDIDRVLARYRVR